MRKAICLLLTTLLLLPAQQIPVFRASSNLVIVTVFVRDREGQPVTGLKAADFVITENGKPQAISVFEFQQIENAAPAGAVLEPAVAAPGVVAEQQPPGSIRYRDKRLMVLFFDWSSMPTGDQIRAKESAEKFVREQMTPVDLVALASFGSKLKMDLPFSSDQDELIRIIRGYQSGQMSELAEEGNTDTSGGETDAFAADETEFNLFNTDRKLGALEDLSRQLSALPEKKAVIYFTSGVGSTGSENDSQLRSTINSAVRANVSLYPVDVKGLTAEAPGGDASTASRGGTGLFSGQTQRGQRDRSLKQEDTLFSLAVDTGGKALIENNDLTAGIRKAQEDVRSYYVLGYYSSDERKDGEYRKVDVKLARAVQSKLRANLDYRSGYYADKEWKAFSSTDKEKQLEDALLLGDPVTDLPVALEVNWFRTGRNRYFVPVAVKIPGFAIPVAKKGSTESTQFDFIAQVRDAGGAPLSMVRDTIKIQLREEKAGQLASRSLIYDTGFTLSPGRFTIKLLARENLSGKMGTFETKFEIPDVSALKNEAKLSSVVWGAQKVPIQDAVGLADKRGAKKQENHPLVIEKEKLLPSVTHVYRTGQTLFAYAELYDPSQADSTKAPAISAAVTVYQGSKQVLQSRALLVRSIQNRRPGAAPLLLEVPLNGLPPGQYTAQFNVIDEAGQKFAFSRAPLVLLSR